MLTLFEIDKTSFDHKFRRHLLPSGTEYLLETPEVDEFLDLCVEILEDETNIEKHKPRLQQLLKNENVIKYIAAAAKSTVLNVQGAFYGGIIGGLIAGLKVLNLLLPPWFPIVGLAVGILGAFVTSKITDRAFKRLPANITKILVADLKK